MVFSAIRGYFFDIGTKVNLLNSISDTPKIPDNENHDAYLGPLFYAIILTVPHRTHTLSSIRDQNFARLMH